MINDKERRVVAARMREIMRDDPHGWLDVMVGKAVVDVMGEGATIGETVADLIDRPTAKAEMDYEAMEDGVPDCRIWTCDGCNERFLMYRGSTPAYCPVCGAEVVDE